MEAEQLWRMDTESFNAWRKFNDYPRIFAIFQEILPNFDDWLRQQELTTDLIFDHGFARFIGSEEPLTLCDYGNNNFHLFLTSLDNLPSIRRAGWILSEKIYEPYFYWLDKNLGREKAEKVKAEFGITSWVGGKPEFCRKIFLLNLGDVHVQGVLLSGRHLDFCCLDRLTITGGMTNVHLYVWYSSAIGLELAGGGHFWNFYKSRLWLHGYNGSRKELILRDGIFQDLHFKDCDVHLHVCRSKLHLCSVTGPDFDCVLEYATLENVVFDAGQTKHNNYSAKAKFYSKAKGLYSGIGNSVEAGNYFYKEKICEMLSLLYPMNTFWAQWAKSGKIKRSLIYFKGYSKFLSMFSSFAIWGFGERPIRSLFLSVWLILGSAAIYFFMPDSTTSGDFYKSLYFSIVTFVTLGYGDISQTGPLLRLYSSLEAFGGMFLMGIFLAGYASKTKQY